MRGWVGEAFDGVGTFNLRKAVSNLCSGRDIVFTWKFE